MKKLIIYTPKECLNDATEYYVNLLRQGFESSDFQIEQYDNLNFQYNKNDSFLTIRSRDFTRLFLRTFSFKIYNWYQGISPEEYALINNYTPKARLISFLFSVLEFFIFRISYHNFFVSLSMKNFLIKKYKLGKISSTIIPCYNKHLNNSFFDPSIKKNMSFVYAGSLYGWQCFEKTVELFSKIEKKYPNASFTILTKDIVDELIIKKYNISNYNVKYVPLNQLDTELSKYQFGFMLREDIAINRVSTPTKMNSYLACGIIPIYTAVIDDFNANIKLGKYELTADLNNFDLIVDKIVTLKIDYIEFYNVCNQIFCNYYDDNQNILKIKKAINEA